ncbi:hypothetical protein AB0D67_11955 [Streptosporangium sp. NPDC048047]|uniref:hypothetical protein n=1 Tax=Streptosporangium sp. NPDC048047 TaxID=3155748 RepID=UPI0034336ED2
MEYRRAPLPDGSPGVIVHTPLRHRIVAYVDEGRFDPELAVPMNEVSTMVLNLLEPVEGTRPTPAVRVRVRRSGDLAGELVVAEIMPDAVTVGVEKSLMSEDLAAFLSEAGTRISRGFVRRVT